MADVKKVARPVGPKVVYIVVDRSKLPEGTTAEQVKAAIVSIAPNATAAVDLTENNANLTFRKLTIPKGTRAPSVKK